MKKSLGSIATKLIELYLFFFLLIVEDFGKCALSGSIYHVIKYVSEVTLTIQIFFFVNNDNEILENNIHLTHISN